VKKALKMSSRPVGKKLGSQYGGTLLIYSGNRKPLRRLPVLRALLLQLQILYSVRSERLLVEEIDYNILFHWF
jgi:hypothetical protein